MKKALLFLGFMLSAGTLSAGSYWGDFKIPVDRSDVKALNVQDTGVQVASIHNSSVTNFLGLGGVFVENGSTTVRGSSIAVFGVLTSTTAEDAIFPFVYVELRASDTANTSSELLVPPIMVTSDTRNSFIQFNPPIIAHDGLSCNIVFGTNSIASVSVFYRYLSTGTEDFIIPKDINGIAAVGGADFYGVKVASSSGAGGAVDDSQGNDGLDFTTTERMVLSRSTYGLTNNIPGLFYGMGVGSTTTSGITNFATFRSTSNTGSGNDSSKLMVPIFYNTFNLEDALWTSGHLPLFTSRSKIVKLPWPVRFEVGLTQQRSSAIERFRVFLRPLNTNR